MTSFFSENLNPPTIGVLSLQGAFQEHQTILENMGCKTVQVRSSSQLQSIDGLILPGGESTAMSLIGNGELWSSLQSFIIGHKKPTWGTCAGMILLVERCVGTSAVIENGQSLIGGMEVLACRNYFGSQISSFEMGVPPPPGYEKNGSYPGVFIRAPAILNVYGEGVDIFGRVVATPCKKAAGVLQELDQKIENGEEVLMSTAKGNQRCVTNNICSDGNDKDIEEEKKEVTIEEKDSKITLPGAAEGTNARDVICSVRKGNILCTAFHPELTDDYRWHEYFVGMVVSATNDCK